MEYVRVLFPEQRRVIIDDVDTGQETGDVIQVEGGNHLISLSGSQDFEPPSREVVIENSSVLDPLEVKFIKREAGGG